MVSFENDYNKGAHPVVMEALMRSNLESCTGYGNDSYCLSAKEKIRKAIGIPDADIYFISGGTQTNSIVIASMLREYEGVVAATTGHISIHEAGAIEGTGHKVIELPSHDGKVDVGDLEKYLENYYGDSFHDHIVFPGMLYISFPTELGTLYTKAELKKLRDICTQYHMSLFLDGARLGYGLASPACDVTMEDIARLTDVFYIGGTKVGALLGEAVVFTKHNCPEHFMTVLKRHGGLLAKGRVMGVQFDALFTDGLYFKIGRYAMDMAAKLKTVLTETGCTFFSESPTNQQYIVIEDEKAKKLSESVAYSFWERVDKNHIAIRFVTSWGTTGEELEALKTALKSL